MADLIYRVRAYRLPTGRCPVREFIAGFRKNKRLHDGLLALTRRASSRHYHKLPFYKPLGDGLHELRLSPHPQRIIFSFEGRSLLLLLTGVTKKQDALPQSDLKQAQRYRSEYKQRLQDGEHEDALSEEL